ncbi:hypothetical protein BVRB_003500 [Beta vulgaris subsp. vulgaris]|uniref:Uncharacterized protein n=1 Tax=Beta vulgaris subsp. vulgaris TaxID=3555 RepID=A0A0J8B7K3_BETVV|nr:hypothetical protein BVRB_003500 [Beta vulgaris subsp. vulgaris]
MKIHFLIFTPRTYFTCLTCVHVTTFRPFSSSGTRSWHS